MPDLNAITQGTVAKTVNEIRDLKFALDEHAILAITDPQGVIQYVNDQFCAISKYAREELVGQDHRIVNSGYHPKAFMRNLWATITDGNVWKGEIRNRAKDGSFYWVATTIVPIKDENGRIKQHVSIRSDITGRKMAEEQIRQLNAQLDGRLREQTVEPDATIIALRHHKEALRASEERFRQLAENINEVFWILDPVGERVIYLSPACELIFGRSSEELSRSPEAWLESVHSEDRSRLRQSRLSNREYSEAYRIVRPDGSVRWIRDRAFPIKGTGPEVYRLVGIAEDFTETRRLEEQLRHAQKMETMGQLAGGIAHEFNNMLAVIQMQIDLLMIDPFQGRQLESVKAIETAAKRAAALTRKLLVFSRKGVVRRETIDLNHAISQTLKMLERVVGETIEIKIEYSGGPLRVHADGGLFDQVLINMVVNARDAMPQGGKLGIKTEMIPSLVPLGVKGGQPGDFACVSVTDTGTGISPENLGKIFEPFFTTKEAGKGTGLGLAISFSIIQQHNGWITVESEFGKGARFRVFLPLASAPGEDRKTEVATPDPFPRGSETILLAEGEAELRKAAHQILSYLGYRVLAAADGLEAMEIWKQHGSSIDLLLTDLVMPGIPGNELAKRLCAMNPKLKVVFASGYGSQSIADDPRMQKGINFLNKPFLAQELAEILRAQLDVK